jgi:GNAT superfamily N-acetyltransferase
MLITPDGCLSLIMVRPAHRRKGLGSAMLRYAKQVYPHLHAVPAGEAGSRLLACHRIPVDPPEEVPSLFHEMSETV